MDEGVVYREVIPNQSLPTLWKALNVNIGESQRTLQDINVQEFCGAYTYKNFEDGVTRNRFIYWRGIKDTLELREVSFDYDLVGPSLRIRFSSPLLPGVSIAETPASLVILVPTVSSVHLLKFLHPRRFVAHNSDRQLSVFHDANTQLLMEAGCHSMLPLPALESPIPHAAASFLTQIQSSRNNLETVAVAWFAIAYSTGEITVVEMFAGPASAAPLQPVQISSIKQSSFVTRLFGAIPLIGGQPNTGSVPSSLCFVPTGEGLFLLALCRDAQLRLWFLAPPLSTSSPLTQPNKGHDLRLQAPALENPRDNRDELRPPQCHYLQVVSESPLVVACCVANEPGMDVSYIQLNPPSQSRRGNWHIQYLPKVPIKHWNVISLACSMTSIFCLSRLPSGSAVVHHYALTPDDGSGISDSDWTTCPSAVSQPPLPLALPNGRMRRSLKEETLSAVFSPDGAFTLGAIRRAVDFLAQSIDLQHPSDPNASPAELREEATAVVEALIYAKFEGEEEMVSEDDYQATVSEAWMEFHRTCVYYNSEEAKALSLFLEPKTGFAMVIRRTSISVLRRVSRIENLSLRILPLHQQESQTAAGENMTGLPWPVVGRALAKLERLMLDDPALQNISIEAFAASRKYEHQPAAQNVSPERDFRKYEHVFEGIGHSNSFQSAVAEIVEELSGPPEMDEAMDEDSLEVSAESTLRMEHFLSSCLGISFVANSVEQQASAKCALASRLWLLVCVLQGPSHPLLQDLSSCVKQQTVILWLAQQQLQTVKNNGFQKNVEAVMLHFGEAAAAKSSSPSTAQAPASLPLPSELRHRRPLVVEQMIASVQEVKTKVLQNLSQRSLDAEAWKRFIPNLIAAVERAVNPKCGGHQIVLKSLFHWQEFETLQDFIDLQQNFFALDQLGFFYLALSYLATGECRKASECFQDLLRSKTLSPPLLWTLFGDLQGVLEEDPRFFLALKADYALKALGRRDLCAELDDRARSIVHGKEEKLRLLSVELPHRIALREWEAAWDCLRAITDAEERAHSLGELVTALCRQGALQELITQCGEEDREQVVRLLEQKAAGSDLNHEKFYEFLYTFHTHRMCYRDAAAAMFELGQRLAQETSSGSVESVERQVNAYLMSINSLSLCEPRDQWIERPPRNRPGNVTSTKRSQDDRPRLEDVDFEVSPVVELSEIRNQYELALARRTLSRPPTSNLVCNPLTPSEAVSLLGSSGHFRLALQLSRSLDADPTPALIALTDRVSLFATGQASADATTQEETEALLRHYVVHLEGSARDTKYHHLVAQRFYQMDVPLPDWLEENYKERNVSGLIRLQLDCGLLSDATNCAIAVLDALQGDDRVIPAEKLGIKTTLQSRQPAETSSGVGCFPVWISSVLLDRIEASLEAVGDEALARRFIKKVTDYQNAVEQRSSEIF